METFAHEGDGETFRRQAVRVPVELFRKRGDVETFAGYRKRFHVKRIPVPLSLNIVLILDQVLNIIL